MMTHPRNQSILGDQPAAIHCARLAVPKMLLAAVLIAGLGNRCAAQNIRQWNSNPAVSYPVRTQTTVESHHRNFSDSAPLVESRVNLGRDTDVGLTSPRAYGSQLRHSFSGSVETLRPNVESFPSYDRTTIQTARHSATQLRLIAQSGSAIAAQIAVENAKFAEQWADLAESYGSLSDRVQAATAKLDTTTGDLEDVSSKINRYGLTPTIGLLLRHKKEQLDEWQVDDSLTRLASQELSRSRQEQLELEMVRYDGADALGQTAEILAEARLESNNPPYPIVASQVQGLLHQRHQWLELLRKGYQDYQGKLGELDAVTTASAKLTSDYRKLIDRHITWIRSGDPVSLNDVRNLNDSVAALFDSRRTGALGDSLGGKLQASPLGGVGLLACIALMLLTRWRAKTWLVGIGSRQRMRQSTADSRKVAAGVLTILVALVFPSVLYVIARWLANGVVSESTLQASSGLYAASMIALMVEVPRQLLRTHGYVDQHVDVELPRRQRAMMYLTVIGLGLVLAAYVVTVIALIDHGMWRDSAARFGFMAALLLVAWTAHLSLRPTGGFLEPLIARFGGSVIHRVRIVIYLAGLAFPLAMVALSALGYGFTANELIQRAIVTLVCLLIAATLWAGLKILSARGWQILTGSDRRSSERDEYGEIPPANDSPAHVTGVLGEHFLELKHQLAFLCQCGLVLAAIACFGWYWIDIFPNARMGNPVVWTVQETLSQSSIDAAGNPITQWVASTTPVTALHLLLAAAILFVAFQLAKLLPALFDALVLQRVSFDEGMEHLSLVLGRCLLFGGGCFVACRCVGVRWQAIEWLAVGLTIGLGFGLQDMVRNLFGGFVVLFEKPARLGDLITVGKVTGRVAAQKLRTTVLSDDEGREVIIPNKNFISEDVVNWMGAGRISVIPIEVAVSRDERPADICRTLQELVIEQPDVLLTPAPQATLICVGKRSQRIEVRVWIEQGRDGSRFQDETLKVVRRFLAEKNLLYATQPTQPAIRNDDHESDFRSATNRRRKRSA